MGYGLPATDTKGRPFPLGSETPTEMDYFTVELAHPPCSEPSHPASRREQVPPCLLLVISATTFLIFFTTKSARAWRRRRQQRLRSVQLDQQSRRCPMHFAASHAS